MGNHTVDRAIAGPLLFPSLNRRQSAFLMDERESYNSPLPINRLPFEILAKILNLVRSSPENPFNHQDHRDSLISSLVTVPSYVCSHWRLVALISPHLWVDLHLHRDDDDESTRELLARAKSAPLSTSIDQTIATGNTIFGSLVRRYYSILRPASALFVICAFR
jgi:hypothetical protein